MGCTKGISTFEIFTIIPVSVNKINPSTGIRLYPNPAFDKIHIDLQSPNIDQVNLKIFDVRGELMEEKTFQNHINTSIDIAHLPAGIYFFEILAGGEVLKNEKVMVLEK